LRHIFAVKIIPHRLTHRFLDRAGFECYVNFFDLHRLAERTQWNDRINLILP
jgi:hypothetical protein